VLVVKATDFLTLGFIFLKIRCQFYCQEDQLCWCRLPQPWWILSSWLAK